MQTFFPHYQSAQRINQTRILSLQTKKEALITTMPIIKIFKIVLSVLFLNLAAWLGGAIFFLLKKNGVRAFFVTQEN